MIWLAAQHFCQLSELPLFNDTDEVLITLKSFNFPRGSKMWSPLPPSMPESVVPIFRALGPLETYLSELYTHNFGTIGCAIWVDTDVGYYFLLLVSFCCAAFNRFLANKRETNTFQTWLCSKPNVHSSGTLVYRESTPSTRVHPNDNTTPPTVHQTERMAGASFQQDAWDCNRF